LCTLLNRNHSQVTRVTQNHSEIWCAKENWGTRKITALRASPSFVIGGSSLVSLLADHSVTGVKTFGVGYDGVVYQKDLGSDALSIVKNMELYNPDKTWSAT
jgi:hypothetical protein